MKLHSIWLFRLTTYSYCQGTRDSFRVDMRLLQFSLPCDEFEARNHLIKLLKNQGVEFDENSIENCSYSITNS